MNRNILSLILLLLTVYCFGQEQTAIKYGDNKAAGNYKKVNGSICTMKLMEVESR